MADTFTDRKLQRNATNSSLLGGIGQRLTNMGLQRRTTHDTIDDTRGQLGLNALTYPKDPLVELILVHGLRGDSLKTWTYNDDPATFWPHWLVDDSLSRFQHVRIHTYGYNAVNAGSINEFGASLLHDIIHGPCFRQDVQNPIVFIAHSLGGLVVKKAFILASQNPEYRGTSQRFHTIFFLATPHRGADSAIVLNNILRTSSPHFPRAHVNDLEPNSSAVEGINENFRHIYHGLRLVSFYELRPPSTLNTLVVDKQSATLGFSEERQIPLNTDHFGVCRFPTGSDPIYIKISDTLGSTVGEILHKLRDPEQIDEDMRILGRYLMVSEAEEEELSSIQEAEVPGSCQWLLGRQTFIDWRDAQVPGGRSETQLRMNPHSHSMAGGPASRNKNVPRFFWLTGPPGSGKSVLAAHVVRHLLSQNRDCSFFFLRHSDKSKQYLSSLLKSLAIQTARRELSLRQSLLSMQRDGSFTAETNDIVAIWKQLFVQKVFRTEFSQRQYWIIDALDECHGGHELINLLARISAEVPLSIFLTSRRDLQLERSLQRLPIVIEHIDPKDTLKDIGLFLEANRKYLPLSDPVAVRELIGKLMEKSRGSFLWIRLVMEQLEISWSDKAIDKALEDVPLGMYNLYTQLLEDMSGGPNEELAKAILRWVVCGARLLTTTELQEAIRLDIDQKVFKLQEMIDNVCGGLVTIDRRGRVQLVHDTARDFLLDKTVMSDFAIDKAETHVHLADICLRYLMAEDTKGPSPRRHIRAHAHSTSDPNASTFKEYAAVHWSEHVVKSSTAVSQNSMNRLDIFLETSIISWVEYIARKGDLSCLTQTAKNLKSYVDRRVDFQSPLDPEMQAVQEWAVDLIRLVTVFGRHLLRNPSVIRGVIPALCPPKSMLFKKFGNPNLGLEVVGLSPRGWADRIHSTTYSPDYATAVACSEKRYAVGLRSGKVVLYYASTCQEASRLEHGEPVKQLEFAHGRDWLIVSSKKKMSMWNTQTYANIWNTEVSSEPLALTLREDDSVIIAATRNNNLMSWTTADGKLLEQISWHGEETTTAKPPQRVYISSELSLLALVYRNKQVRLFALDLGDLNRPRLLGGQSDVSAMAFNPAENMVAVVFFDGELCTISLWNLRKVHSASADASHLAVSTDGKTLIVGTNSGSIQIRDFETLNVMQTIKFNDEEIMSIAFAGNGLRFLDIRRQEFNVWEPSSLVRRKEVSQSTSESETFSTAPSNLVQGYNAGAEIFITAMVASGDLIFCGKDNGAVSVYQQSNRGRFLKDLCGHDTPVIFIDWSAASQTLVTSDSSSRILVHKVREVRQRSNAGTRPTLQAERILDKRLHDAVRQILLSLDGQYLLVSTSDVDQLWTLKGEIVLTHNCGNPYHTKTPSQKWSTYPQHKRKIFEVEKTGVHVIEWEGSQNAGPKPTISAVDIDAKERIDNESRDVGVHFVHFSNNIWAAYDNDALSCPVIWPAPPSSLNTPQANATARAHFAAAVPSMKKILGMAASRLVFLDLEGWVCTLRLDEAGQDTTHKWHFPIPHCWQSTSRQLLATVTAQGDVIVAKGDELAIVKRWLA